MAAGLSQSSGKVLRVPWSMAFTAHADLDHCSGLCYLLPGAPPDIDANLQANSHWATSIYVAYVAQFLWMAWATCGGDARSRVDP